MRALGANTVRIHLQLNAFMQSAKQANPAALQQLRRLIEVAAGTRLYLILTGLGTYRREDVPDWYRELDEAARWEVQASFWEAVAQVARDRPAVLAYDLMNEPLVPGERSPRRGDWLAGKLGDRYFAQYITLDLRGRSSEEVAASWVQGLVTAIRKHDRRHLVTVGVAAIPSAARSYIYGPGASGALDFVSIHLYPESGRMEDAIAQTVLYSLGKPLVVSEIFPLGCEIGVLAQFIVATRDRVSGWLGFYWGQTAAELSAAAGDRHSPTLDWLRYFHAGAVCDEQAFVAPVTEAD